MIVSKRTFFKIQNLSNFSYFLTTSASFLRKMNILIILTIIIFIQIFIITALIVKLKKIKKFVKDKNKKVVVFVNDLELEIRKFKKYI